jgi:glycosyltransferase involved in cell wall biosynthesis
MSSLIVLQVVEPGVDGAFRHVEGLVHFLAEKDVEVHLAYSSLRGSRALGELISFVESRGGETLDMLTGPAPHPRDGRVLLALRNLMARHHPQIVHGHSSKAGGLVRLLALAGMSPPTFYTPHAYFGMDGRSSPSVAVFNLVERMLGGIGTTINISPDEADFARTRLGISARRSLISHNPVNPDRFFPPSTDEKRRARLELGLPPEGVLLGSVGRLSAQKNPLLLTQAFAQVVDGHPDLGLVHLGQGPLRDEVEAMRVKLSLDGRIFTPPYQDDASLFYRAIDAFVLSSDYEAGWPIVVLEAMCCNLPLIVTSAPGMSEIGQSGLSHCWTAPPGEVESLGQAIESWLLEPRADRACNHRDYVFDHFTPEKCYGSVLAAYRQAIR